MEEMNHFTHKNHSLKLIKDWETISSAADDNGDKSNVASCYGCQEPIIGGLAYGCTSCHHYLHETCAKLAPTFIHRQDPLHPLILKDRSGITYWCCDVCGREHIIGGLSYCCSLCNFDACLKCVVAAAAEKAILDALRDEATINLEHKGHPQHILTLQLRSGMFHCDACYTKDEDFFYQCDTCDFWIHKTCAFLDPTIDLPHSHNHPLILVYSLPSNFCGIAYNCAFCNKCIQRREWLYHCANCRYVAHIKCAINVEHPSTPSDTLGTYAPQEYVNELLHFPMSNAFIDPLKALNFEKMALEDEGKIEITHWSHNHTLFLTVEPQGNNLPNSSYDDDTKVCNGCARPISLPYYNCKDGCSFILHKYCAELPSTLKEHQLHPNHLLVLVHEHQPKTYYRCKGCFSYGNTFVYKCETCVFRLDVNCAFLPNMIKHKSHRHPLIQVIDPKPFCKACDRRFKGISYACKDCDFQLCTFCAIWSPHFLTHRYCKGHEIPLTYPPIEDHPENFYCDICEREMHPMYPLYHCIECKSSFHLSCISRVDRYANVKEERTMTFSYHKHPLTFVRRKKSPEYVCFYCNLDINNHLILECRTERCPFRICFACHKKRK